MHYFNTIKLYLLKKNVYFSAGHTPISMEIVLPPELLEVPQFFDMSVGEAKTSIKY